MTIGQLDGLRQGIVERFSFLFYSVKTSPSGANGPRVTIHNPRTWSSGQDQHPETRKTLDNSPISTKVNVCLFAVTSK
jgi:hypothetical protein